MSSQPITLPDHLTERKAALAELDIQNSLQIARDIDDSVKFAVFLDRFYTLCSETIGTYNGEVIKYLGDSCLCMFDEDACIDAIDTLLDVRGAFPSLCEEFGIRHTGVRGSVHTGTIVYGEFGPEKQKDVLGKMSNELFTIDRRGVTITEQVYRKLPNDRRSEWKKTGGQVVYVLK